MAQTNISVLHGFFEEVINQRHVDALSRYYSEKFVGHDNPYVGMGVMIDDSSGDKVTVRTVFPGSPAEGKLIAGDEILSVADEEHSWNSYEELRNPLWGQGVLGTLIKVQVRRDDSVQEIEIKRGLVKGAEYSFHQFISSLREDLKVWRELKTSAVNVIESGDMVAYQAQFQGYNNRFGRSAVWMEFGFARFKDGMIVERWISEETIPLFKQLGFTILPPEQVRA